MGNILWQGVSPEGHLTLTLGSAEITVPVGTCMDDDFLTWSFHLCETSVMGWCY